MKKCKYCNVEVETPKEFCPLCFNRLEKISDDYEVFYELRKSNDTRIKTTHFLYKLFAFISICAIVICGIVNYVFTPNVMWSLVVVFSIFYVWVLVAHTILSKQTVFKKVLLQIFSILILLYFAQKLSVFDWLLSYVYPSVSMCSIFVTLMLLFISKKRKEYLIGFLFIYLILLLISIFNICFKWDVFLILNYINVIVCSLSIIGVLIFGFNAIKEELIKKWHI